jgi:hypothetical protein
MNRKFQPRAELETKQCVYRPGHMRYTIIRRIIQTRCIIMTRCSSELMPLAQYILPRTVLIATALQCAECHRDWVRQSRYTKLTRCLRESEWLWDWSLSISPPIRRSAKRMYFRRTQCNRTLQYTVMFEAILRPLLPLTELIWHLTKHFASLLLHSCSVATCFEMLTLQITSMKCNN